MIALDPPLRLATAADGPALAELVNYAGEGLPLYLWRELAGPGEDPWAIGAARQARRAEEGQIVAVDEGRGVLAAMTGYPIPAEPEPPDPALPEILHPLEELERRVPRTWYLNVLATYPRARGKGLGARLVGLAETFAQNQGLSGVSMIVADQNVGALRLYERLGYGEVARAEMVKMDWESPSSEWILLKKPLAP